MAGFFDNAWWRDKNTQRNPDNPWYKQAGTVAKGFGGHLANKLMPFQMGKEGMEPRKGYNPLNLVQLGLMGMSPESQFTYDRKGNEYRAGFGDWMSNVANMGQKRMMEQQKMMDYLIDKPLSRKLKQAQISKYERESKEPIKPVQTTVRKGGEFVTTTQTYNPDTKKWDKEVTKSPIWKPDTPREIDIQTLRLEELQYKKKINPTESEVIEGRAREKYLENLKIDDAKAQAPYMHGGQNFVNVFHKYRQDMLTTLMTRPKTKKNEAAKDLWTNITFKEWLDLTQKGLKRPVYDRMILEWYGTKNPEEEKPSPSGVNTGTISSDLNLE
tara:strand:+ start:818 stop:1798 length:981 start_codon:yes stop_codon:yes gene_type:complete